MRSPKVRWWRTPPQQGMSFLSAPENGGPAGVDWERCGRTPGTAVCFRHPVKKSCRRREASVSGGLAVSRPQVTRLAFPGLVAVCGVVVKDLSVLLVQPGGLPVAAPLATRERRSCRWSWGENSWPGVPSAALRASFYIQECARGVLITWCMSRPCVKSNAGSPTVEEMYKH